MTDSRQTPIWQTPDFRGLRLWNRDLHGRGGRHCAFQLEEEGGGGGVGEKGQAWRHRNRAKPGEFWRWMLRTRSDFLSFLSALNEEDPAIRFTEEGFGRTVHFLDVRITLAEDGMGSSTPRSLSTPTPKTSSSHPHFVTKSSALGG